MKEFRAKELCLLVCVFTRFCSPSVVRSVFLPSKSIRVLVLTLRGGSLGDDIACRITCRMKGGFAI
jgi:hypothetical protein